jgi:large subunit ribosomal protein L4
MAKVSVYNMEGNVVGDIEISDEIFQVDINKHLMHRSVVTQLANKRQGTQSAKTRAEVRGGGAKPFRQKGTGKARQGSLTAPNHSGGGVVFAPKPRDYSKKLNKKERRAAIKSALSAKLTDEKIIVIDQLEMNEIKTKEMKKVLDNLNITKALIVMNDNDQNVVLSARNIPDIKTAATNTINVYDILKYDTFLITKDAIATIEEVYA